MSNSLSVYQRVWQFAWPAIISNISVPLLGLVDAGVLGHLPSSEYLAGVAIAATVFSMLFWAFGFLRMGTTGLVAQAKGRKDSDSVRKWLLQSVVLALVIGLLLMLFSSFLIELVLPFFEASAPAAGQANIYFETRIYSAPAVLINYALIGWLIGMHRPRGPLLILVVSNAVNIALDLLFVLKLGWATQGAALATVIADYVSLAIGLYLVRHVLNREAGAFTTKMLTDLQAFGQLMLLNRHLFVRTLCLLFVQAFFTAQGAKLGDEYLAANALLLNLLLLISNGLDGFAHAAEALTGEAVGRKNNKQFHEVIKATGWCSLICGLLFVLVLYIFGEFWLGWLTSIPAVAEQALIYLPWLIIMPMAAVWCFWLDGVFIGAVRTDMMQHTMLVAALVVFLPVWYFSQNLGNHGLWLSYTIFMMARSVTLLLVYRRFTVNNIWIPGEVNVRSL